MKTSTWVIVAIVAIVGLLLILGGGGPKIEPAFELNALHPLDRIKGNPSGDIVLLEYSDFQCPACRSYYPILRQVVEQFGDRVTFVYRHFPLSSIHPNADFAARAAEAAGMQGKFWEMHDLLFEKQAEWSSQSDVETIFSNYATLLGIDVEKFKIDWRSDGVKNLVNAQKQHAIKSGFQGTPTFLIDGKVIENPKSKEHFESVLMAVIDAKK